MTTAINNSFASRFKHRLHSLLCHYLNVVFVNDKYSVVLVFDGFLLFVRFLGFSIQFRS